MLGLDIAGAIEKAVMDLITIHRIDRWCRLVFTMAFSGVVSFLVGCGGGLVAHRPWLEAVGTGMLVAAVMLTKLFRSSELTKGMTVAVPASEAKAELETDTQVIMK